MSDTYWKIEKDDNNIAWLHFDTPDSSANLLSQAAIKELDEIIRVAEGFADGTVRERLRAAGTAEQARAVLLGAAAPR